MRVKHFTNAQLLSSHAQFTPPLRLSLLPSLTFATAATFLNSVAAAADEMLLKYRRPWLATISHSPELWWISNKLR